MRIPSRLGLAICALLLGARASAATYTIRWVQIHQPIVSVERAAKDFAERIEKATNGDVRVEIITKSSYEKLVGRTMSNVGVMREVNSGKVEMCQIYTHSLWKFAPSLLSLSMPYLFRDYDHAEQVIEGPIGRKLVGLLSKPSRLKALGIAYSGGFGIISTKDLEARRPGDLNGLRMLISRFVFAKTSSDGLNIEVIVAAPDAFVPLAQNGLVDAAETTMACFDMYGDIRGSNVIMNTEHFLLTSMIVINDNFYRSLPEKYRDIIVREAWEVAKTERQASIEFNRAARVKLAKNGVKIIDLTSAEKDLYKTALQAEYDLLDASGRKIVADIRATAAY